MTASNIPRINVDTSSFAGRYCSCCGKEVQQCECEDSNITISISIPRELIAGLTNLSKLIPKIQITSDKCGKCGHMTNKCSCDEEKSC